MAVFLVSSWVLINMAPRNRGWIRPHLALFWLRHDTVLYDLVAGGGGAWIFSIFVVDAEASFVDLALSARLNPAPWLSRPLLLVARPAPPLVTPHCSVT